MSKWARFLDPPTVCCRLCCCSFSRGGRATETVDQSLADILVRIGNVMKVSANFHSLYTGRGSERVCVCVCRGMIDQFEFVKKLRVESFIIYQNLIGYLTADSCNSIVSSYFKAINTWIVIINCLGKRLWEFRVDKIVIYSNLLEMIFGFSELFYIRYRSHLC